MGRTDNVLTFTIDGKNTTTNRDIYYEIKLMYGDNDNTKTRLNDSELRFDLEETIGETTTRVLDNVSLDTINGTRIWVNTVKSGEEIERTYTLRAWISDEVLISDTDINATYTTGEYFNRYATIKVMVYGDFEEKKFQLPINGVEVIKSKVGKDGLVGININGELAEAGDTIREYRYSGNALYCTYRYNNKIYTLNVESDSIVCRNACINKDSYIIHKGSDVFSNDIVPTVNCDFEISPIEIYPTEGDVKNYVMFNNELWRIIGLFEETVIDDGEEKKAEMIKLIKDKPILREKTNETSYTYNGSVYDLKQLFNSSSYIYFTRNDYSLLEGVSSDWNKAILQNYLNNEDEGIKSYYNTLSEESKAKISKVKYHLGNVLYEDNPVSVAYNNERGTRICSESVTSLSNYYNCDVWYDSSPNWFGKIGLMYPSDYGYAADSENWNTPMEEYDLLKSTGNQKNWLRDMAHSTEWLISPSVSSNQSAFNINYTGNLYSPSVTVFSTISPVLYLKSNTTIVSGTGAWDNPYLLG